MPAPEVAVAYVSIVPSLQGFQQTLRNQVVGPSADAGGDAGDAMGSRLGSALKAGAAAAALAAGAVIAKGLGDAIDQANVTSKLKAQLGASGKDAARYGKVAGKLYASGVVDTFQTGADTIRAIVNAGLVPPGATNAQLQSIATKMADVSSTFGTDMSMQTQAVSALMKNGLAPSATAALDTITIGMQKLGPNAEDLLETFQEYPVQLKKLGLDSKTALGLFQQGLQGGARDTDIIADAMKEFSIRAIDMSTGSRDAYKAMGLDAKVMESLISKGGASATKGLDTVLDKLRAMKDPVAREAAAVGLFGTQAEDLGAALFKLDPSKATAGLEGVSGSTKRLGDSLRSGPIYEIQTFTRSLQQGLVNVLGTYVIPSLTTFISVVRQLATSAIAGFRWIADVSPYLAPFAILIGGITLALNAQAIAVGFVTAVFSVYRAAMIVGTAITSGFAAAQAILNAVMALNPFVLVGIALAALVAGIVVAYKRSETFRAIVQAAWKGIQTAVSYAWNSIIKPAFAALMVGVRALGAVFKWLYNNAVKPVIGFIVGLIKSWWNGAKVIFNLMSAGIRAVGAVFKWLYNNAVRPAWNGVSSLISSVYNRAIKPVIDKFKSVIGSLGGAFRTAVAAIKTAWDKITGIAKKPVKFIIDTVYNGGIVKVWNKIAGAFGAPKLSPMRFAKGGVLPGYTPGRDVHLAALSGGEAVMRPEWTRAMGPDYVNSMNALARQGGVGAVQKATGGLPAFKNGGIFDWIGSAGNALKGAGSTAWNGIKKGASWLKDSLEASARAGVNAVVNPLMNRIPGLSTGYGKMVKGLPKKAIDTLFGYSKKADSKGAGGSVGNPPGSGVARWRSTVARALQANGLSTDSGMVARILRQITSESGGNPRAVQGNIGDVNNRSGDLAKGLMQTISATFNAYKFPGHGNIFNGYDNLLAALNYAKNRYGSSLSFLGNGHGYDSGGWLQPGATMAVNKSGKPEPILSASQWSSVATLASRAAGSGGLQPGDRLILSTGSGTDFEVYVDQRAGKAIDRELATPATLGRTL